MLGSHFIKSIYSAQAALTSYYPRLRRIRGREGRFVLFAAMPKSGSTYLTRVLSRLLGYEHSYLAFSYQNVEQELYVPKVLDAFGKGSVVQQHFKANDPNLEILETFAIRPIVLTRHIQDVVVSLRDHVLESRFDNLPSLHPPREFREHDAERQFDFLVDFFGPWLIGFYVSWIHAERASKVSCCRLRFEDCIADWPAAIETILGFLRLDRSRSQIEDALNETAAGGNTRLNKGVVGRGDSSLTDDQLRKLAEFASYYQDIDFSPVGLPSRA